MKTICIFSALYFPHLGGVEQYTYNLAKYLTQKGNRVVIVTSNAYRIKPYEKQEGIEIYRVPCWNVLDGRFPVLKPDATFRKIHKRLMEIPFDLVLINTRFYPHTVYGTILARMQKTKCVIVDHGTSHLSIGNGFWDTVGSWYEHLITKVEQINCSDFYGVSLACVDWLGHFHIQGKGVLYNAVDLEKIEALKQEKLRDFRSEYVIPEEGIMVSFTGRLLKEKGVLKLAEAVKRIRKKNAKVYLLMAGAGEPEMEQAVKDRCGEGVILLGRLDFPDIVGLLQQSDIFCLPTDYPEGFPTSVLEGAACECYVITTTRGGSKEMITDASLGAILEENSVGSIERALLKAVEDPEYRKSAAEKVYQKLKENYTWDVTSDQVLAIAGEHSRKKSRRMISGKRRAGIQRFGKQRR